MQIQTALHYAYFLLGPALTVGSTVILAIGLLGRWRNRRNEDLLEATTTWRVIAESREAQLVEKDIEIAKKNSVIFRLGQRCDYLWTQLLDIQTSPTKPRELISDPEAPR